MSHFIVRALHQGRAVMRPFAAATPFFPRAILAPKLQASLFSTQAPQPDTPETPEERSPKLRTPTPPPTKSKDEQAQMPYTVGRTPSTQLPVYRQTKSGGTLKMTYVKRIEGDRMKLAQELGGVLNLDPKDIKINPTTKHIEIKGDYLDQARTYLLEQGF